MVPKWLLHKHIATIKKTPTHHQTSSNILIWYIYIYTYCIYIYPPYPHYIPLVIYQTSSICLRAAWCRAVLSVSSTAFTSISLDLLSKYSTTWKKRGWKILQEWRSIAGKIMENHRTKWGRKKLENPETKWRFISGKFNELTVYLPFAMLDYRRVSRNVARHGIISRILWGSATTLMWYLGVTENWGVTSAHEPECSHVEHFLKQVVWTFFYMFPRYRTSAL